MFAFQSPLTLNAAWSCWSRSGSKTTSWWRRSSFGTRSRWSLWRRNRRSDTDTHVPDKLFRSVYCGLNVAHSPEFTSILQEERSKVDDLRGTPMSVGTLEEIIDDNHAIVSTSVGSEHYVSILSFVDKDLLEPGCSVLLNHKVIFSENHLGWLFNSYLKFFLQPLISES